MKYFGETVAENCRICDVCVAQKKSGLSAEEFSTIVEAVENELKQTALTTSQLTEKLKLKAEHANTTIEYLLDKGKVSANVEGKLKWL